MEMKKLKRQAAVLIAAALIAFTPLSISASVPAAPAASGTEVQISTSKKKTGLNANAIILTRGTAYRLAVLHKKQKVTWSSKNKKVATVNSLGCVKGKAAGKTTIWAKAGSKKYSCRVTVQKRAADHTFYENITELAAGTVVDSSQIDFSSEKQYFTASKIDGEVYKRIRGKSFDPKGKVKKSDLRYVKVLHYNYKHEIQVGELIVNKKIADDICTIFRKLFEEEYEIYSMYLIDDFWTGNGNDTDDVSCRKNNTSAFCYRPITGGGKLSNHSYGLAIDINTVENPYVTYWRGKPYCSQKNAKAYVKRSSKIRHEITHSDYCYKLFKKYGFSWGGDWKNLKDYQHFEKN